MTQLNRRVCSRPTELLYTADGRVWTGDQLISSQQASTLASLGTLVAPDSHAQMLARHWGMDDADDIQLIREQLQELEDKALLVNEQQLYSERCQDTARISSCIISTCNRPTSLKRTLSDLAIPAATGDRKIVISNDGDLDSQSNFGLGLEVEWLDRQHRQHWIDSISEPSLRTIAQAALLPQKDKDLTTGGSTLNAGSLSQAGEAVALFDDDIRMPVGRALPSEPKRWELSARGDPTLTLLYDDFEHVLSELKTVNLDPVTLLETGLGQAPSHLMFKNAGIAEDQLPAAIVHAAIHPEARVLGTMMGFAGDSGMVSPRFHLGFTGDAARRLEENLEHRILSRQLIRAAECHRLSTSSFYMNACSGMDFRHVQLPFFPYGRDFDGIFGISLQKLHPQSFRLYLPYAITHKPPELRRYTMEHMVNSGGPLAVSEILKMAIRQTQIPETFQNIDQRTAYLSSWLSGLAQMGDHAFREWVMQGYLLNKTSQLNTLNHWLEIQQSSRQVYILRCRDALLQKLEAYSKNPTELAFNTKNSPAHYRKALQLYADQLAAWPELIAHHRRNPLCGEIRRC